MGPLCRALPALLPARTAAILYSSIGNSASGSAGGTAFFRLSGGLLALFLNALGSWLVMARQAVEVSFVWVVFLLALVTAITWGSTACAQSPGRPRWPKAGRVAEAGL